MEDNDLETFNTLNLKHDIVYNTQICSVIYTNYGSMKGYFWDSWAAKRRDKLFNKYVFRRELSYNILRIILKWLCTIIILGFMCLFSYLANDILIGAGLGYLGAQLVILSWVLLDDIRKYTPNQLFIRRKINTN